MATAKSTAAPSRKVKFTAAFVSKVVRGELDGEHGDSVTPLRIRRTSTGAQYLVRKKVAGKLISVTARDVHGTPIADAAKLWTLAEARTWARGVVADLTRGKPPVRREKPASDVVTFATLAAELLESYATEARPNSLKVRTLGVRDLQPLIGNMAVTDIKARDAVRAREAFNGKGRAVAQRAWVAAGWVMSHAVERELADGNPFGKGNVRPPARPAARARYPKLPELVAIDQAAAEVGTVGADVIRFAMRCPLRVGAITTLAWGEIDLAAGQIRLAVQAGRKFQSEQRIPLSGLAVELLAAIKGDREPPADAYVFPGPNGPIKGLTATYKRIQALTGFGGWSIHDFRRSVPSILMEMEEPGCDAYDLDRWLGHSVSSSLGSVGATYQRGDTFRPAKRAADAWDNVLRVALAPNVVSIRREVA